MKWREINVQRVGSIMRESVRNENKGRNSDYKGAVIATGRGDDDAAALYART